MKKERIHYIDIAKAFGIIAIVMGHIYGVGVVRHILYAFHVPLFFFLSALFLNTSKPWKQCIKEKFHTIMIPYYCVSLISIAVYSVLGSYVAQVLGKSLEEFADNSLKFNIIGMFYANSRNGLMNWNRPLWFLPCLFITTLLLIGVEKCNVKNKVQIRVATFLGAIGGGYLISRINLILPFQAECSISMLAWMELALLMKPYVGSEKLKLCGTYKIIGALLALGVAIYLGIKNEIVDIRINYYGNYVLYLFVACVFIILLLSVAKTINRNKVLEYIGKNTMPILLFHKFPILFFQSVFGPTRVYLQNLKTIEGTVCAVLIGVLSILSCLILNEIYQRIKSAVKVR